MLPKKYRLPIQKFLKNGRTKITRGKYFFIKTRPNNLSFSRFGVIVSGKVSKSAVKRNKIKRIIFNFIRLNEYFFKKGIDILIIILVSVNQLTKQEIESELKKLYGSFI